MRVIKLIYEYLFYFFYRGVSKAKPQFWLTWKANMVILVGEFMILASVVNYYTDFTKSDLLPENRSPMLILLVAAPLIFIKFWFFDRGNRWKMYIDKFESWPKLKRNKWDLFMWMIVILVLANLIFSFYWMSQIDWSLYNPNYVK